MAKKSKCRGCREWKARFEKVIRENQQLAREVRLTNEDRRETVRLAERYVSDLTKRLQKANGWGGDMEP